jgi:hypothetical protein
LNGKYNIYKILISVQDERDQKKRLQTKLPYICGTPMITPTDNAKTPRPSEALYPNPKGNL